MIFEIISGGEKTDWVGKEWAGLFFPRGKNGPAHSFPGEKTDWGEIPACYTGSRSLTADPGAGSLIWVESHAFVQIRHEIVSTAILLPSTDSRRVVVSYTKYWSTI